MISFDDITQEIERLESEWHKGQEQLQKLHIVLHQIEGGIATLKSLLARSEETNV